MALSARHLPSVHPSEAVTPPAPRQVPEDARRKQPIYKAKALTGPSGKHAISGRGNLCERRVVQNPGGHGAAVLRRRRRMARPADEDGGTSQHGSGAVAAHNWTLPERTDDEAWRDELAKLRAVNDELVAWLKERPAAELLAADEQGEPGELTWVLGIMLHDSYHVGQIATLRALMGLPSVEG